MLCFVLKYIIDKQIFKVKFVCFIGNNILNVVILLDKFKDIIDKLKKNYFGFVD